MYKGDYDMGKYILEALEELNKIEEDYLIEMANIVGML